MVAVRIESEVEVSKSAEGAVSLEVGELVEVECEEGSVYVGDDWQSSTGVTSCEQEPSPLSGNSLTTVATGEMDNSSLQQMFMTMIQNQEKMRIEAEKQREEREAKRREEARHDEIRRREEAERLREEREERRL